MEMIVNENVENQVIVNIEEMDSSFDDEEVDVSFDEDEKVFEHYLELPEKIRMKLIDKMQPEDRFRLIRCSKLCGKEARECKNFIYGLQISGNPKTIGVSVEYDDLRAGEPGVPRFMMMFEELHGLKYVRCVDDQFEYWRDYLDNTIDLVHFAAEHFKKLLKKYQNRIKRIGLGGAMLKNYDFEIESLNRLEEFEIDGDWDLQHYFSKIHHPLNTFCSTKRGDHQSIVNCEQLYQVKQSVVLFGNGLNYQEFLRLSAFSTQMEIAEMTEKDVFKIVRSWQNGTIREEDVLYKWKLGGSNFDITKLLRLLRVKDVGRETFVIEIKHFKKAGESSKLKYSRGMLIFDFLTPEDAEEGNL